MAKYCMFFLLIFISCKSVIKVKESNLIEIENSSIRSISINKDKIWFAGSNGKYGTINFENDINQIFDFKGSNNNFRSSFLTFNGFWFQNIESPMQLNYFDFESNVEKIKYKDDNKNAFYDSMYFSENGLNGILLGDPYENCFTIVISKNGGENWNKIQCEKLPLLVDGEAAFAASNTNVKIVNDKIFIISGGKKSRLIVSSNLGETWGVIDLPIIQGEQMTGAYSMDFYNENIGIIGGGNYDKPNDNTKNCCITYNGGKTWELIENTPFGFISCIQFIPNMNGRGIVTCGQNGVFISNDFGKSWIKLLDDKDFYTLRIKNKNELYLAGKNKIMEIEF